MTTREITGTIVGVRQQLREDATRLFAALLGTQVAAIVIRCEGASLPALAQMYDPGSLRAARVMRVHDCRVNGTAAWIVRVEGAEAEVLAPALGLKVDDPVVLALDVDAQPRVLPVGGR